MAGKTKHYPEVNSNPHFPTIETKIIEKWKADGTFKKTLRGDEEFVFYDGPPFANGLPHYGHLLTGNIKDLFARYQTSKGKKVDRRFGWDCHGLPAEMGTEKDLGISGKLAIEEYGIEKFNDYCRSAVLKYTKEWQYYITRQGRWVDFADDYRTMDISYMESVLWAFKTLHEKGLLYESMRVLPYSWACETPVSDFETKMDNSYRQKTSKSVIVSFELTQLPTILNTYNAPVKILVWTTTPWTLPSNLALAVNRETSYVAALKDGVIFIAAHDLIANFASEIGTEIITELRGEELIGLSYKPLLEYFKDHTNAFKILHGDFVTTDEGTGVVHIAPGFGEDDYELCKANDIEVVCPVDNAGKFTYPVEDLLGIQVFDANDEVIKKLKLAGNWLRTEQYIHNYPHCWRTDTPLIYKAVPSWYLKVTAIKEQLIANNQQINWIPGHIKDGQFGKWLENCRDWSISRNRYWGCPIPVWKSDDPQYPHIEVYGSIKELEQAFGVEVKELHRPFIDTLTRPNPKDPTGKSKMVRVTDVLDCWFESGSMPYAQVHYPFENKEWFESHSPADFIVEYQAQTRGWFYTLHVLSTALFSRPAFLNCICHGVILGDGGQKLSKRLKNYADPNEVFDDIGADALRWYMISAPVMRGYEIIMDKESKGIKESLRLAIKPLWNAFNFFTLYANADGIKAEYSLSSDNLMDRYIIAKCIHTLKVADEALSRYDTQSATSAFEALLEVLNNWYIRRCRERFWRTEIDQDKISAYNTLFSVLTMIIRGAASLLPMITEEIYLCLNDNKGSVHLESYPTVTELEVDIKLIETMDKVRAACTAALFIRSEAGIRVRQPLHMVTFIGVADYIFNEELHQLILDEINVKIWNNADKSSIEKYADYKLALKFPVIGKRIPDKVKEIIAASKSSNWSFENGGIIIAGERLLAEEFELKLEPKAEYAGKIAPLASNDALVLLDLTISPELELEGLARDLVRAVQQMRKNAGLDITDKIKLSLQGNTEILQPVLEVWTDYIKEQTLCIHLSLEPLAEEMLYQEEVQLERLNLLLALAKS